MQYQIYNKFSGETIALIDTKTDSIVVEKDYAVKSINGAEVRIVERIELEPINE